MCVLHLFLVNRLKRCVFVLLLFSIEGVQAQRMLRRTLSDLDVYTSELNARTNMIHDIYKDVFGYFWLATELGIMKFDGKDFNYLEMPTDRNLIMFTIVPENDSILWFGSTIGLVRVNILNNIYEEFNENIPNKYPQRTDFITRLKLTNDPKKICVASLLFGIGYFDKTKKNFDFFSETYLGKPVNWENYPRVTSFDIGPDGLIWGASAEMGLFTVNPNTGQSNKVPLKHPGTNHEIQKVYEIKRIGQDLWVITQGYGLYTYNLVSKEVTYHALELQNTFMYQPHVQCFVKDKFREEIFWVGTPNGLYQLNTKTGHVVHYIPEAAYTKNIYCIYQENVSKLWIGTDKGMFLTNLNDPPLKIHPRFRSDTSALYYPLDGNANYKGLFYNNRLYILNADKTVAKTFDLVYRGLKLIPTTAVWDKNDRIWMYTADKAGFFCFDLNTHKLEKIPIINEETGLHVTIWYLYLQDTCLFISTNLTGLYEFDIQTKKIIRRYKENANIPGSLPSNSIGPVMAYNEKIVVGAYQNVVLLDRRSGKFLPLHSLPDTHDILSENLSSWAFETDREKNLWIAASEGLVMYNPTTQNITYKYKDPIESTVYSVKHDGKGNMWFATETNFLLYKSSTNSVYKLSKPFGITEIFLEHPIAWPDGELWFPTKKGILVCNAAMVQDSNLRHPIYITEVSVNNTKVNTCKMKEFQNQPTFHIENIFLEHYQNSLEFKFIMLNYFKSEFNHYKYKLEGYDTEWYDAEKRNVAYYTQIPPGVYTFKVKASDLYGNWSENFTPVRIHVYPAFWQTWWFRSLIALFVLIVFVVYFTWRTRQITLRNKKLKHLVALRTKEIEMQNEEIISINEELKSTNDYLTKLNEEKSSLIGIVSHDLKAPINRAIALVDIVMSEPENINPTQSMLLQKLKAELMDEKTLISDILTIEEATHKSKVLENLENKNITDILRAQVQSFSVVAQNKNIELTLATSADYIMLRTDPIALIRVLDNLISNALKFSPKGKKVAIFVRETKHHVEIEIKDQGPGFSPEDKQQMFKKYAKMTAKPTAGESSTGLGLSIVKTLVESLQGIIVLSDNPEGGTIFTLKFPKL